MPSKRSVLKKIRAGLVKVPEGWEKLVDAGNPTSVEIVPNPGIVIEVVPTPPIATETAAEDFRSHYPPNTKTDTATTAPKKRTRKAPTARKTRKSKKSS
jgi:hypothetical protein